MTETCFFRWCTGKKINEAPLEPWVINRSSGEILSVCCNCMADLAEVCTHVTSLLFWTEISIKIIESSNVTDQTAYWVAPSNLSRLQPQHTLLYSSGSTTG